MTALRTRAALMAAMTLALLCAFAAYGQDISRMSKDELKAALGKPDVIVLDVRAAHDWISSQWKIQGALREDPAKAEGWVNKYPKDKTLVLYCA